MDTPFFNMLVQIFLDDYSIDHVISKLTTKLKTKKVKPQTLCFGDLVLNIRTYLEGLSRKDLLIVWARGPLYWRRGSKSKSYPNQKVS